MNNHPLNLALRFVLEIILLIIFAYWGWSRFMGISQYVIGIGLPLVIAAIWGVCRVEGDPGKAMIAIPGWLRLLYEALLFISAAYLLFQLQMDTWAYLFIIVSILHYLISYDRISWLLKQ
jgi:hypothetical protein